MRGICELFSSNFATLSGWKSVVHIRVLIRFLVLMYLPLACADASGLPRFRSGVAGSSVTLLLLSRLDMALLPLTVFALSNITHFVCITM